MWLFGRQKQKTHTNSIHMDLIQIQAGSFNMGSPKDEPERISGETLHHVTISKPFFLSTTPVTQKQWKRLMGNNPAKFKRDEKCPVESISWDQAVAFCTKLSAKEKRNYRLPTEAEWEFACRAGTETPFYTGQGITRDDANYNGRMVYPGSPKGKKSERTTPVGQHPANPHGLADMHGNVWEWCSDWYDRYALKEPADPTGPRVGRLKAMRGGSWEHSARRARSACRRAEEEGFSDYTVGMRVLMEAQ